MDETMRITARLSLRGDSVRRGRSKEGMMTITQAGGRALSRSSFWLGVAAYLVPTFPIAFVWHLVLFAPAYEALGIYRPDPIIPFGFASMVIQGIIFSWTYPRLFPARGSAIFRPGLAYCLALRWDRASW
jgi:hypothetical protein